MHKKDQGSIGEALVVAQALEYQCAVFTDFGDNSKIDLIIEDTSNTLHRVQVKCVGREKKTPNVSLLYLYKSGPNYNFAYEANMFDWFALVDYVTKKIAWISFEEASTLGNSQLSFRHDDSSHRGGGKIRRFDDYTKFPF